ncbi:MAG: cation transporter [Acholeplasmatales bacterium]|nr:cation transporter [Acholeplasmatales bacterium]
MKKIYDIEVDCAACALKCEEAIKKVDGVNDCSINFMTQKMTLDADDQGSILKKALKAARKVEPDFEISD